MKTPKMATVLASETRIMEYEIPASVTAKGLDEIEKYICENEPTPIRDSLEDWRIRDVLHNLPLI